jgi:hypothetical protein
MKKLIIKTSFFIIPFLLLFIISQSFYKNDKGDLLRLGYIYDSNNYDFKVEYKKYFDRESYYKKVSEINLDTINSFDFVSIGDSFSSQGPIGYQNCLVYKTKIKLLDIDRDLYDSPIQGLYDLINGGFFNKNKTKYVILQNVERSFVERGKSISKTDKFTIDSLKENFIKKNKQKSEKEPEKKSKDQFFSKDNIRFFMYNFNYLYDDNANVSPTYKVNTTKRLFSVQEHKLLFFEDDTKILKSNNDKLLIENLNNELNILSDKLASLNIKLIVLPSPDKYDIYYNYIVNKEKYEKPIFFDHFNTLKKRYIYINSKNILTKAITTQKDVYFYDDTHWSPIASELIASEISHICKLIK